MKKFLVSSIFLAFANLSHSWDVYDYDSGSYIEIDKGNLVRPGSDIEIYDYSSSEYKDVEVQSISGTEIEVYDYDSGEYRTFEMD
jgi:hypothetical protein